MCQGSRGLPRCESYARMASRVMVLTASSTAPPFDIEQPGSHHAGFFRCSRRLRAHRSEYLQDNRFLSKDEEILRRPLFLSEIGVALGITAKLSVQPGFASAAAAPHSEVLRCWRLHAGNRRKMGCSPHRGAIRSGGKCGL